jgi:hypothetical protein
MTPIQTRKRQLEKELKEILDNFHKENQTYKVSFISVQSNRTETHGRNKEVLNNPVKVNVTVEVL